MSYIAYKYEKKRRQIIPSSHHRPSTTIHDKNFQGLKEGDYVGYFWTPILATHREDTYYDAQMDPRT